MNQNEESICNAEQTSTVNVFFRNCRKEAKLVPVQSPAPPPDLAILASICFNLPHQRVVLFYNGFRVDTYELPVHLTERGIIHVIDQRNLDEPEVIVNFRPLWNAHLYKIALPSDIRIKQVVEEFLVPRLELPGQSFFLVYVGKVLNRANMLQEECVEDGAEIAVVKYKKPECINRIAVERQFSRREEQKHGSIGLGCPVTYLTSLQSLKKKSQQSQSQYSQKSSEPKPAPEPGQKLNPVNENEGSESAGPLQKSAMLFSKSDRKSGAGANSEERAGADEKGGSASGRSGSEGIKIVITGSGSGPGAGEEKGKGVEGKILGLQSKSQSKNEASEAKKDKGSLQKLLERMESQSEK